MKISRIGMDRRACVLRIAVGSAGTIWLLKKEVVGMLVALWECLDAVRRGFFSRAV